MAHDAPEQPPADRRAPVQEQPSSMHVTDAGGDYGYDAAHDLA